MKAIILILISTRQTGNVVSPNPISKGTNLSWVQVNKFLSSYHTILPQYQSRLEADKISSNQLSQINHTDRIFLSLLFLIEMSFAFAPPQPSNVPISNVSVELGEVDFVPHSLITQAHAVTSFRESEAWYQYSLKILHRRWSVARTQHFLSRAIRQDAKSKKQNEISNGTIC